ncbi:hypothetical protein F5884DRAFT_281600 [Xylogone sp. PMI_703]|nr:hypothetical protein F5884DRAFT_281600 [Xylogone sp. PMI_703]
MPHSKKPKPGPKVRQKRHQRAGSSSSWTADHRQERAKLLRIQKAACHHGFYWSPAFPRNLGDFLHLKEATASEKAMTIQKKLDSKIDGIATNGLQPTVPKVEEVMKGKVFEDGRSLVLAMRTVWSPNMGRTQATLAAPWPEPSMFQECGSQRINAGKRRILPPPATEPGLSDELMQRVEQKTEEIDLAQNLEQKRGGQKQPKQKGRATFSDRVPPGGWLFNEKRMRRVGNWSELLDAIDA